MTLKRPTVDASCFYVVFVYHHQLPPIPNFPFATTHIHMHRETLAMTKHQCFFILIVASFSISTISFHFGVNNALAITKAQGQLACPISPRLKTSRSATEESMQAPADGSAKPDKRPHAQRVKAPRKARRMNHSFMHLYRKCFSILQIPIPSTHLTNS